MLKFQLEVRITCLLFTMIHFLVGILLGFTFYCIVHYLGQISCKTVFHQHEFVSHKSSFFLVVQLTVLMVYIFLYGKTYLVRSFHVNLVLCDAIIVSKLLAISICQFVILILLNVVINLYFYVYVIDSEVMHSSNSFSRFNVFNLTFVIHPSLVAYFYMTSVNFLHFFSLFIFHSFLKVTLGPA